MKRRYKNAKPDFISKEVPGLDSVCQLSREHLERIISSRPQPSKFGPSWKRLGFLKKFSQPDIVIKPADKKLGLVLLNCSWYVQEALRQLSDPRVYSRVASFLLATLIQKLEDLQERFSVHTQ